MERGSEVVQPADAPSDGDSDSSRKSPSGFFDDDLDEMEIPSDEYLSNPNPLPRPTVGMMRPRLWIDNRNATVGSVVPANIFIPPPAFRLTTIHNEDDAVYRNQLEVADVSDINDNPIEDNDSTSGTDDETQVMQPIDDDEHISSKETDNNLADGEIGTHKSDDDDDTDDTSNAAAIRDRMKTPSPRPPVDKPPPKQWLCQQCDAKTEPMFRFCLRCFKIRREWLPKRKRLRKSRTRPPRSVLAALGFGENRRGVRVVLRRLRPTAAPGTSTSSSFRPLVDNPVASPVDLNEGFIEEGPRPSAQPTVPGENPTPPRNIALSELVSLANVSSSSARVRGTDHVFTPPSQPLSQRSNSPQSQPSQLSSSSGTSAPSTSSSYSLSQRSDMSISSGSEPQSQDKKKAEPTPIESSKLCNICLIRVKDSAFVHNKVAHQYGCFSCADKILKQTGRCPICRRKVLRVVKLIDS